jgi:hypothetical protein
MPISMVHAIINGMTIEIRVGIAQRQAVAD